VTAQRTLPQLQHDLLSGQLSCQEIAEFYLHRASSLSRLNAYTRIYADEIRQRAETIDRKIKLGKQGPLAGMVVGIKDNILYEGHPAQAASNILKGFTSPFSATVVERLVQADALIIGHQNCDEFGMGSASENSAYGPVHNGLDESRSAGGSSGGSAVAVQMDMCRLSVGSDTGGSVRQPAAFCGIMGLKPTYGRISRHGLIAYASSMDCIGLMARNAEDIALTLQIAAGADAYDSTASRTSVPDYLSVLRANCNTWRFAYYPDILQTEGLQPEVQHAFLKALERLRLAGMVVEPVQFKWLRYLLPTYYLLASAEASSNLARYDGVRYGYRTAHATDPESLYKKTRSEGFGNEVQRRIMLGTFVLTSDYYDAYYIRAQQVRRLISDDTYNILRTFDFIISPTAPTTAFPLDRPHHDPVQDYLADIFSVQANITGIPAISVPCGKDQAGLPIGLQLMAGPFEECKLLQAGKWFSEQSW
jgi:aspartyl-tRNA(Asn)/glutamyl-tRNA(Gln) amidotransferase subunit A